MVLLGLHLIGRAGENCCVLKLFFFCGVELGLLLWGGAESSTGAQISYFICFVVQLHLEYSATWEQYPM